MSNVQHIFDPEATVLAEGEPQDDVIAILEMALERAKAGEVQAVALATLHADRLSSYNFAGPVRSAFGLLGAVEAMKITMATG